MYGLRGVRETSVEHREGLQCMSENDCVCISKSFPGCFYLCIIYAVYNKQKTHELFIN